MDPPSVSPASSVTVAGTLIERAGWSLVWLGVLASGLSLWAGWTSWPGAALVAPLLVLAGMIGMAAEWLVRSPRSWVLQLVGLGTVLFGVATPQAVAIHVRQYYNTDSAAFNQVAAQALLHGRNPFTTSMASAASLLKVPAHFWSYTVDGGHVTQVSYPAGSFLLQVPAMALGFHHEIADWMDLGAWLVTGVLLFVILPASLRWLAALIVLSGDFVGMFSNGGTDAIFVPFLVVAVWQWDRFATGKQAGLARWIGPVALGLACSIKQTPWFCVPFLVVGVALESQRRGSGPLRTATRYLAVVTGVFVVVNLPFIVWQPSAWMHGIVLPFADPLVADGQGVVTLALHGLTGGVVLPLLSVAGALVYLALMAAFAFWYPSVKRVWLFLLPVVLFVPARSLSSYLMDLFPIAIVGALTVGPAAPTEASPATGRRWWPAALAVAVPVTAAVVVAAVAFTSAPLQLSVRGFRTSNFALRLDAVTVTVRNRTDHQVTPHFMVVVDSGHPEGFWTPSGHRGPLVLNPGASATVTLHPTIYTWSPEHGGYWLVEAYTSSPNALSTSPLQLWRLGKPE